MPTALNVSTLVWLTIGVIIGSMAGETYLVNVSAPQAPSLNLYVFDYASRGIAAIDVTKMQLVSKTPVDVRVGHAILSTDGKEIYAVADEGRALVILDVSTLKVQSEIPLVGHGEDLAVTRDGRTLLVTTRDSDSLTRISTEKGITTSQIKLSGAPHGVAVDREGLLAYVAETGSNRVSVVSLRDGGEVRHYTTGSKPTMVALSIDDRWLAVGNSGRDSVTLVDLRDQRESEIATGRSPRGIAFAAGKFYVANWGENSVAVVDPVSQHVERILKLDARPQIILTSPYGQVYVGSDGGVFVISTTTHSINGVMVEGLQPSDMILTSASPGAPRAASTPGKLDSKNFTCGG